MVALCLAAVVAATNTAPCELGLVPWQRDLPAALASAKESGRPVFVLFQEVPGCHTCQSFGNGPLSQPLLVEAIETEFIPVLIYNNKPADAGILKQYQEPAWNNPVVRFLAGNGADLIPRQDGVWTTGGIAQRMVAALQAAKRAVPKYLVLVAEEAAVVKPSRLTFTMGCFWSGEAKLGTLDGVIATRAGWAGKAEAVEVTYDPERLSEATLTERAKGMSCTREAHTEQQFAVAEKDTKFYLKKTPYAALNLTPLQATRINAALVSKQDPTQYLSPRQRAQLATPKP